MKIAEIQTNHGTLVFKLFEDVPHNVENFCKLAESGFYDGLTFYKYVPTRLIQTGSPNNKEIGGVGYSIKCELDGENQHHEYGSLAMAHTGRDGNGSQFYICLGDRYEVNFLDTNNTCIGIIIEGKEILRDLRKGDTVESVTINEKIMDHDDD